MPEEIILYSDIGYNGTVTAKDEWVKLRISAEDKVLFSEQAEEEGLSLSAWMRSHLRRIARQNQGQHKLRPVAVKKRTAK